MENRPESGEAAGSVKPGDQQTERGRASQGSEAALWEGTVCRRNDVEWKRIEGKRGWEEEDRGTTSGRRQWVGEETVSPMMRRPRTSHSTAPSYRLQAIHKHRPKHCMFACVALVDRQIVSKGKETFPQSDVCCQKSASRGEWRSGGARVSVLMSMIAQQRGGE